MIRFIRRSLLLCSLAAFAACSNDSSGNDGTLPDGFSRIELFLCAEPQLFTRAPWNDANAVDEEMMKEAMVVMVKENAGGTHTVERIIPVAMDGSWHERHSIGTVSTEDGTYTFYSFGNIEYTTTMTDGRCTGATVNGITFTVGQPLPGALESSTWTADFNNAVPLASPSLARGIPMTNREQYLVNSSRSITLHLFRMLSKVSFEFSNKTDKPITVQKIELAEVTKNGTPIYFLPPKEGDNIVNRFPAPATNVNMTVYDDAAGFDVPAAAPGVMPVTHMAYFNESVSKHPTGQMPLTVTMKRDGEVIDTRYALVSLSAVPRNTYVVVPIALTEYMLELKAFFYAPIGGYPPYSIEAKDNDFYCKFSTGGDFVLRPFIYRFEDRDDESKWFELTDATKVESYEITVSGDVGIFSQEPNFSAGEILGTLNGTPGTASVRLTANLIVGPGVTQIYTRTIYIMVG